MNIRSLWYWLALFLILGWIGVQGYVGKPDTKQDNSQISNATLSKSDYIGIQKVAPSQIRSLFSDAKNKPLLIMFHSQFCFDCKRMKPVIDKLVPKHKKLVFQSYDVLKDKNTSARIFSAFKPVTVPALIFVKPNGSIAQVLYNYQKTAAVESAIMAIGG